MKNSKRVFLRFRDYEGDAFSRYLEGMAAQGWHFQKMGLQNSLLFEKGNPVKRRYCAVIVPEDTEFSEEERAEKNQFRQLCEEAGWRFICGEGLWQIFSTVQEDAIPIETDSELWLKSVKKTLFSVWRMMGTFGISFLLILALGKLFLQADGKSSLSAVFVPALPLLLTLVYILMGPAASFIWYRKAKRRLATEGLLPENDLEGIRKRSLAEKGLLLLIAVLGARAAILGRVIYMWFYFDIYRETISYMISQCGVEPEERKWALVRVGMVFTALVLGLLATAYFLFGITV